MENCGVVDKSMAFQGQRGASPVTVRGVLNMLLENLNKNDSRPVIPLGYGDPSAFPSFRPRHNLPNSTVTPPQLVLFLLAGYPYYEARAGFSHLEVRHFDLVPEKGWEVDLDAVEDLSDENTVAIVIINPGNPCANVYRLHRLLKNWES